MYLFEFLDVDVELRAEFGFGLREGGDLLVEGLCAVGFLFGVLALLFVAC